MISQKYRGSCIGAALTKWLAKNTVASQKIALEEKMEDGALEMLSGVTYGRTHVRPKDQMPHQFCFFVYKGIQLGRKICLLKSHKSYAIKLKCPLTLKGRFE